MTSLLIFFKNAVFTGISNRNEDGDERNYIVLNQEQTFGLVKKKREINQAMAKIDNEGKGDYLPSKVVKRKRPTPQPSVSVVTSSLAPLLKKKKLVQDLKTAVTIRHADDEGIGEEEEEEETEYDPPRIVKFTPLNASSSTTISPPENLEVIIVCEESPQPSPRLKKVSIYIHMLSQYLKVTIIKY